jgi:hypothetical protein
MPFFAKDPSLTQAELAQQAHAVFEKRARDPHAWHGYALILRDGARLLWGHVDAARDDAEKSDRFGLTFVALMLAGLAIEVLAKALLVQQDPAIGKTFHGDKWHDLVALVTKVKLKITRIEREELRQLTGFVKFAGRYPIPTGPAGLTPKLRRAPRPGWPRMLELAPGTALSVQARPVFERIFARLETALTRAGGKSLGATHAHTSSRPARNDHTEEGKR